jgi:hypothetical protein
MNRLHRERMPEDKGNLFLLTQVRQPIPGEDTLDADDQIVAVRSNETQKCLGRCWQIFVDQFRAVLVQNADVHRPCM